MSARAAIGKSAGWKVSGVLTAAASRGATLLVVFVLCLTPITAVLATGWVMRLMRREVAITVARRATGGSRRHAIDSLRSTAAFQSQAAWPAWIGAGAVVGSSRMSRTLSTVWHTLRTGIASQVALTLFTLPFGALLLVSWWGGWENSFNKGYEQAFVGPVLAALGLAVAMIILTHLPMAAAHMAAEGRAGAMFELQTVRALVKAGRWRNVGLAAVTLLLALPLLVLQVAPTFVEGWRPGFADLSQAEMAVVARRLHLAATMYLLGALVVLRCLQARSYALAALTIDSTYAPYCQAVAAAMGGGAVPSGSARRSRFGAVAAAALNALLWLAFLATIYVAQFANHAWWSWINHPLLALPWVFRP